jgi:apolipoprotein N-acyltransferase
VRISYVEDLRKGVSGLAALFQQVRPQSSSTSAFILLLAHFMSWMEWVNIIIYYFTLDYGT